MIELLEDCLRIPSLSGQEAAVAQFLAGQMHARGFDRSFVDAAGNAVGVIGTGPRQWVMLGHMDTVGGEVAVRYEDGRLYGRGAVDAKGPLCAFVLAGAAAAEAIRAAGDVQLIVIGAVEEEAATSNGARFAAGQYQPEWCVIGEPSTSHRVTVGYKGRLLFEAQLTQSLAHTSRPEASANERAVDFWNWFKGQCVAFNTGRDKAFDQLMPSLRHIRSGGDGLREWCNITVGVRLPLDCGPEQLKAMVSAYHPAPEGIITPELSLSFYGAEAAYRSARDSGLARAFVSSIREEGLRPAFVEKTGTADFNVVGPVWNVPIIAYGPGDPALDHTPNEHVEIAEFERGVRVLTRALTALAASPG
jgi:[amino group carrier protein]-lysine/ornithine hydrolase